MHEKEGLNNSDWPHTRESGGQFDLCIDPWSRACVVYATNVGTAE